MMAMKKQFSSPEQAQAVRVLLDDLQRFGYTDSIGTDAFGVLVTPVVPTVKPISPAPVKRTVDESFKIKAPTHKNKAAKAASEFDAEQFISTREGELGFTVILTTDDADNLFKEDEYALWRRMLAAINLPLDKEPSYLIISGEAALDKPLPDDDEELLSKAVQKHLMQQRGLPAFVLGMRALQILSGGYATPATVRRQEYRFEQEKGCFLPLATTYHVHTLLRQPLLKRQAWSDLLQLESMLTKGDS